MFIKPKKKRINEITNFLKNEKNIITTDVRPMPTLSLWRWSIVSSLELRLFKLFAMNPMFKEKIKDNSNLSVLDLGCGFCMYWPFLNDMGCNRFVGIDLFNLRGQGDQKIKQTAEKLINNFCKDNISYELIESDVRKIISYKKIIAKVVPEMKFDIIIGFNTKSEKLGSTSIPHNVYNELIKIFLDKDGIAIYD